VKPKREFFGGKVEWVEAKALTESSPFLLGEIYHVADLTAGWLLKIRLNNIQRIQ
jgi:hypothetical protein